LDGSLLLAMSEFLEPRAGPDQSGDFRVSPGFFIALFAAGFAIAVAGHVIRSRTLVAAGVLLGFAATVLIPIAYSLSN
jgi:hypothetical protein